MQKSRCYLWRQVFMGLLLPVVLKVANVSAVRGSAVVLQAKSKAADQKQEGDTESNSVNATKPLLTGIPQIDYILDPNLPRELNGHNLTDYPFYNAVPEDIDFKCDGLHDGFYASVPHKCQVYHHCLYGTRYDFLCANYTAFDQKTFICHFVSEVDCDNSPKYYKRNEALYKVATSSTTTTTSTTTQTPSVTRSAERNWNGNPHRKRPHRRRRPMYEYYYDDEYGDVEYYEDDISPPATSHRRSPSRKYKIQSSGPSEGHTSEDYNNDSGRDQVKQPARTSGSGTSLYDRPRVPPKIPRPVPKNEREKYDYAPKLPPPSSSQSSYAAQPTAPTIYVTEKQQQKAATATDNAKNPKTAEDEYYEEDDGEYDYVAEAKPTIRRRNKPSPSGHDYDATLSHVENRRFTSRHRWRVPPGVMRKRTEAEYEDEYDHVEERPVRTNRRKVEYRGGYEERARQHGTRSRTHTRPEDTRYKGSGHPVGSNGEVYRKRNRKPQDVGKFSYRDKGDEYYDDVEAEGEQEQEDTQMRTYKKGRRPKLSSMYTPELRNNKRPEKVQPSLPADSDHSYDDASSGEFYAQEKPDPKFVIVTQRNGKSRNSNEEYAQKALSNKDRQPDYPAISTTKKPELTSEKSTDNYKTFTEMKNDANTSTKPPQQSFNTKQQQDHSSSLSEPRYKYFNPIKSSSKQATSDLVASVDQQQENEQTSETAVENRTTPVTTYRYTYTTKKATYPPPVLQRHPNPYEDTASNFQHVNNGRNEEDQRVNYFSPSNNVHVEKYTPTSQQQHFKGNTATELNNNYSNVSHSLVATEPTNKDFFGYGPLVNEERHPLLSYQRQYHQQQQEQRMLPQQQQQQQQYQEQHTLPQQQQYHTFKTSAPVSISNKPSLPTIGNSNIGSGATTGLREAFISTTRLSDNKIGLQMPPQAGVGITFPIAKNMESKINENRPFVSNLGNVYASNSAQSFPQRAPFNHDITAPGPSAVADEDTMARKKYLEHYSFPPPPNVYSSSAEEYDVTANEASNLAASAVTANGFIYQNNFAIQSSRSASTETGRGGGVPLRLESGLPPSSKSYAGNNDSSNPLIRSHGHHSYV